MEVLDRLARKDVGWWSHGSRRTVAQSLALAWAARTPAPAGARLPWPRDHGIVDLLRVLLAELERVGAPAECAELEAVRALV